MPRWSLPFLILILGSGVCRFGSPVFSAETLDLKTSIERAVSNNPRLLSANKDVAVTKTHLREAKSLFYPKVNLNLDYVRYRNETLGVTPPELGSIILEAPIASPVGVRSNPLAENLYLGRLGFVQTLYAGGKLNYTLKRSKASIRRAEISHETLKQAVAFETAVSFFRLLELGERKKVINDALIDLERITKQPGGSHDRLLALSLRSDLRKTLGDLKKEEQEIRFTYLRSMGVELFSELKIEGTLDVSPVTEDLQSALVLAKQNRAELKETALQEEVDQLSVDLSLAERYPVFLLGGGMEVRNDRLPLEEANWNTVLTMNIPLFDGFSSRARIRESRYRADQSRLKRVQIEDEVDMEVRSSFSDCEHWDQEKTIRRKELELVRQSRPRYLGSRRAGAPFDDRLDYLRWFVKAHLDTIESQYEYCMAKARLYKATGRSFLDE